MTKLSHDKNGFKLLYGNPHLLSLMLEKIQYRLNISLWTCIYEEIILILMIGLITVTIHDYAILTKYYSEYPQY